MSETSSAAPAAATESAAPVADASQTETTTEVQDIDLDAAEAELEAEESAGSPAESEAQAKAIDKAQKDGKITKAEAASLKKKLQIKIDGQTEEVELDFNDEEGLKRHIQKAKAFDKRAKEYATLKNNVDSLVSRILKGDEDAEQALKDLGMNPEEFAEKLIQRKIKEMEKSPEQIEQEKMRKELEELRKEKQKAEEERSQMEMEKLRNQYAAEVENEITTALSASSLPKGNPRVVKRIAQTMYNVMNMTDPKTGQPLYPDVKVADVIPVVEKEWKEELRSYFDSSAEEMIEELVGKQNFDRVRRKRVANRPKAPSQTASSIKDTGTKMPKEDTKPKKSMKSFFSED
jgi:chromosome segregation ATPase